MTAAKKIRPEQAGDEVETTSTYDANPFWQSTLFSDVYLRNDVPQKYSDMWEHEEVGPFNEFCTQFQSLCTRLKDEKFESWSERTTINRFIKPILTLLGWSDIRSQGQEPWIEDESLTFKTEEGQHTYKPDFLVVDDFKLLKHIERKNGEAKLDEARKSSIMTIEAKYWGRIDESKYSKTEDRSKAKNSSVDSTDTMDFDEQCLKYVEILNHDFGILTDGRTWRLYHRELSAGSFKRCYQFNLGKLAKHVLAGMDKNEADYFSFVENAKYFYHFFCKSSLYTKDGSKKFVDDLITDSRKYSTKIEGDLKDRFVNAMAIACNGFRRSVGAAYSLKHLDSIRSVSESHIFNILFIRYCESRNVLPLRQNPEYRKISLSNIIDKLDQFDPEKEEDDLNTSTLQRRFKDDFKYEPDGTELYDRLIALVSIMQDGLKHPAAKFSISGFKETVFSEDEIRFAKKHKLANREMVSLLFEITFIGGEKSGRYQQIAYSFFAPRQLGSIYESFLEFRLEEADCDMVFLKGQWTPANLKSEKVQKLHRPKVKKGKLFFSPDNKDRKATGSYYTPEYIVQHIVKNTIGPQVGKLSSKELLKYRVCDPAMGSGHFMSATLNFLAKKYLEALNREELDDEVDLADSKHKVLSSCIYGLDINPRAVKLAKMSLWLESAHSGKSLEHLDDQIKSADTLGDDFNWTKEFKDVFKAGGFDAIVGNPPYRRELDFKDLFDGIAKTSLGEKYRSPRMDLWYYFVHRGIEILRDDGLLSFITNAYWVSGSGAEKLISHISDSCSIKEIVFLRDLKVFDDVSGQHMIFKLEKGSLKSATTIKVAPLSIKSAETLFNGAQQFNTFQKTKADLFKHGKIDLEESAENILDLIEVGTPLGELGLIRQGIAENPASIGKKVNLKHKNRWKTGEGVFALTPKELKLLQLGTQEAKLCRPYHDLCDLGWYWAAETPSRMLIYSTKETCPDIKEYPTLKEHLERFKPLMDSRRETMKKSNKWWHLHWPRDMQVWDAPQKILSVQMGKRPTFASINGACYVPFSVNVFVPNKKFDIGVEYFEGLLNSALLWKWFNHNAKKRGVGLEINGNVLQRAPIKLLDRKNKTQAKLYDKLVNAIKDLKNWIKKAKDTGHTNEEIEANSRHLSEEIDAIVFEIYEIPYDMGKAILKGLGQEIL